MGLSLSRRIRRRRRRNQENDQDHHHHHNQQQQQQQQQQQRQPQSLRFRSLFSSLPPPSSSSSSSSSSSPPPSYSHPLPLPPPPPPPLPYRSTATTSFVILAPPSPPGISSTLPPLSPIHLPRSLPSPPLPPSRPPPPPSPPPVSNFVFLPPPPPPPPFLVVDSFGTLPPPTSSPWDFDLWDLRTTTPCSSSSSSSSPPPSYFYAAVNSVPVGSVASDSRNYSQPMLLLANPRNGIDGDHSLMVSTSHPQPPCVSAKKINNYVVLHRDTIKLVMDAKDFGNYLVSFTFDALVDGSITVFFFAKEEANCTFSPLYPECCMPRKIPFQKGLSQKFFQPSGTGIDLGFFDIDDLSSFQEGIVPLVICVETCLLPLSVDAQSIQPLQTISAAAQVTQAILEKNNEGQFQVRVVEQIVWVDGVSYELLELYGIGPLGEAGADDNEPGKECVICMAKPKDTTILPCRHMCLCSDCAEALRTRSNKCPICRQFIEQLVVMKADKVLP